MKYLALTDTGSIHNLGDCGDWDAADEIAKECLGEDAIGWYPFVAGIDYWKDLAETIIKEEWKDKNDKI